MKHFLFKLILKIIIYSYIYLIGTSLLLLIINTYFKERIIFLLKSSPIRVIRITCGIIFLICILFPLLLTHSHTLRKENLVYFSTQLDEAMEAGRIIQQNQNEIQNQNQIQLQNQRRNLYENNDNLQQNSMIYDLLYYIYTLFISFFELNNINNQNNNETQTQSTQSRQLFSFLHNDYTPRESILYLPVPCVLLSLLISSLYICCQASYILIDNILLTIFIKTKSLINNITNLLNIFVSYLFFIFHFSIF